MTGRTGGSGEERAVAIDQGNRVWIGPLEFTDDGEAYLVSGDMLRDRVGDDSMLAPPASSMLPDHPALPAVARWLAEHPEAVDALQVMRGYATDAIASACIRARADGGQHAQFDELQRAQDVMDALVAALGPAR